MRLSKVLLPTLASNPPGAPVAVPTYDVDAVKPGMLHFGMGKFQSAFSAAYIDDLLNDKETTGRANQWGIVGASIPPYGKSKRDPLQAQDWLYTLVERDGTGATARICGSLIDFLPIDAAAIDECLMKEDIKIVSMTVTEGGYFLTDGQQFDAANPAVQPDIQTPNEPKTMFGMINKAIKARKAKGMDPFSVLCCDNIPHNGDVVRSVLAGLATAQNDPDLADYIQETVACPNSMVDRITPGTTPEMCQFVLDTYGYTDESPTFCEPFRQWVLEDTFYKGIRPPLELLPTVKFTKDVGPYEFMKIRILNGGHASLCYPAALLELGYVHEAMEHDTIRKFLDALQANEIIPTVPNIPDDDTIEFGKYWTQTASRFANPSIMDTIPRICFGGASNQPKFSIPVAKDNLQAGRSVDGIALVSALWCRYCMGTTENGTPVAPNDPQWDRLQECALNAKKEPNKAVEHWIGNLNDVYGSVGKDATFQASFQTALNSIMDHGVEATLTKYIQGELNARASGATATEVPQ